MRKPGRGPPARFPVDLTHGWQGRSGTVEVIDPLADRPRSTVDSADRVRLSCRPCTASVSPDRSSAFRDVNFWKVSDTLAHTDARQWDTRVRRGARHRRDRHHVQLGHK